MILSCNRRWTMKVPQAVDACLEYHQANSEKKYGHYLQVRARRLLNVAWRSTTAACATLISWVPKPAWSRSNSDWAELSSAFCKAISSSKGSLSRIARNSPAFTKSPSSRNNCWSRPSALKPRSTCRMSTLPKAVIAWPSLTSPLSPWRHCHAK